MATLLVAVFIMRRLEWDHLAFVKIVLILLTVAPIDRNNCAGYPNIPKRRSKIRTNLSENHEDKQTKKKLLLVFLSHLRLWKF